jgi:uncharacterized protein (DUF1810 family)
MSGTDENDPYDLQRFLDAQSFLFEQVRAELRAGQKRGHWIWFIFPQITKVSVTAARTASKRCVAHT